MLHVSPVFYSVDYGCHLAWFRRRRRRRAHSPTSNNARHGNHEENQFVGFLFLFYMSLVFRLTARRSSILLVLLMPSLFITFATCDHVPQLQAFNYIFFTLDIYSIGKPIIYAWMVSLLLFSTVSETYRTLLTFLFQKSWKETFSELKICYYWYD